MNMSGVAIMSNSNISAKTDVQNDVEAMQVDDCANNIEKNHCDDEDAEEGEISDSRDADDDHLNVGPMGLSTHDFGREQSEPYENRAGSFITGIDFFGREEQQKLEERARRFGLDQATRLPTEEQLKELYDSLNMKLSEGLDKSYRLNAVHMRGTENLSTQDIFAYFKDYAPSFIEWISDYSCNVVWLNESTAARSLIGLSKPISSLDEYHAKANPFSKKSGAEEEDSKDEDSRDATSEAGKEEVVVVVAEIEGEGGEDDIMVVDKQKETIADTPMSTKNSMECNTDAVKASDIEVPIPPGRWRKGADHPKAKCILLRFSTRSDKKFGHNEKLSEYYKKHGNPKYGGMKGIITASRKRRYQRASEFPVKVFDDDVGDERDFPDSMCEDTKNPWGSLAQSWNKLDKTRGKQPELHKEEESDIPPVLLPRREIILTSASRREARHVPHPNSNRPVFERLGTVASKPVHPSTVASKPLHLSTVASKPLHLSTVASKPLHLSTVSSKPLHLSTVSSKLAQNSESESSESSDSDDEQWSRRSKTPRMRMYADEEEDRLQQRKMLVNLRVSSRRSRSPEDLRSRLEKDGRGHGRNQDAAPRNLSSVWSRLRPAEEARARSHDEGDDDDDHSSSSSSSDSDSNSASASESNLNAGSGDEDQDAPVVRKGVMDLRSKLNMKKSLKQPVSVRQKSPLRIEIDNDEYYRLIGSD